MEVMVEGVELRAPVPERGDEILTREALAFVADLQRRFDPTRRELLRRRSERQARLDGGELPDFLPETREVREGDWHVAPVPEDLRDRRVEITGPVERKMMINALNSGARCFMADFEDANSPTWANCVGGHVNLVDAIERRIELATPDKTYRLNDDVAVLIVRPRGWHLLERHVLVDGEPVSASLFDFGEHELEVPRGSIKATVLIETILAAFEMEEILYELREHSAGLNAGRWDYIFSVIKKFRNREDFLLPDRAQVTMTVPFMRAYTELLVRTCHRRGAHAMGGMAAFVPSRKDPEVNQTALAKVREDKEREAGDGFDGTWVAHPDLVQAATEEFDKVLGGRANQVDRLREDVDVSAPDLLDARVPGGEVTEEGVKNNVSVGIRYLESWLRGVGAAAIYNLMEDAATAEISRSQVWQWLHHGKIDRSLVERFEEDELAQAEEGRWTDAREVFDSVALADDFVEFLTLPAYERID